MSNHHSLKVTGHPNIYSSAKEERQLRIDFSVPANGVNNDTGLLLLVPGFGGNIDSKVYKKLRNNVSDQYNLVVIQCDYFGSNFMQSEKNYQQRFIITNNLSNRTMQKIKSMPDKLVDIMKSEKENFLVKCVLNESLNHFNDMGLMQAIDLITAIEVVKLILEDNNYRYNENKVIGYGHSHGAYLLHLVNLIESNLLSHIFDNSAWIEPGYLNRDRYITSQFGKSSINFQFEYIVKGIVRDKSFLNLRDLYKSFENKAQIVSYQGNNDMLVDYKEKIILAKSVSNWSVELVTEKEVDNSKFFSNTHGLAADFIKLFDYSMNSFKASIEKKYITNGSKKLTTDLYVSGDISSGLPKYTFNSLKNYLSTSY